MVSLEKKLYVNVVGSGVWIGKVNTTFDFCVVLTIVIQNFWPIQSNGRLDEPGTIAGAVILTLVFVLISIHGLI